MPSRPPVLGAAVQALQKKYVDARETLRDTRGLHADARYREMNSELRDAGSARHLVMDVRTETNASYVRWNKTKAQHTRDPSGRVPAEVFMQRLETVKNQAFMRRTARREFEKHHSAASDLLHELNSAYPRARGKRASRTLARLETSVTERRL